jgi:hypothetical protein
LAPKPHPLSTASTTFDAYFDEHPESEQDLSAALQLALLISFPVVIALLFVDGVLVLPW